MPAETYLQRYRKKAHFCTKIAQPQLKLLIFNTIILVYCSQNTTFSSFFDVKFTTFSNFRRQNLQLFPFLARIIPLLAGAREIL